MTNCSETVKVENVWQVTFFLRDYVNKRTNKITEGLFGRRPTLAQPWFAS